MPHTVAENLTRLVNAKTAIGNAITAKGGTVGANDGLEEFAADIETIPSGGSADAVKFYDYDGTVLHSYSASEFANLTELPSNPTHEGLTSQGWNWALAAAKTYVADYGELNIGQVYNTSDGKTRIHITLHDGRLEPHLGLGINGSVDVDWGDGSAHDTMTGSSLSTLVSQSHEYAAEGDYVIVLAVTGEIAFLYDSTKGSLLLTGDKSSVNLNTGYRTAIRKVNIGNNVMSIGDGAFYNYYSLTSITIPNSVTSIGINAFRWCYSLTSITIPSNVTSIDIYTFQGCYSLISITIPNSVTSIGNSVFYSCDSLTSITIPNSVTSIGTSAFTNCYSLTSITIPSSVKSIGQQAFSGCYSLSSITLPNSVTSIGNSAFNGGYGLGYIKFLGTTTIPTIANTNAWTYVPTDCYILVPYDYLADYLGTAKMPSSSTYLYLCYATYADGATLPTVDGDGYTLTWYTSREDARAETNPISVGNGKEIYARGVL